jgi:type I restriction-modification system DNA methylase subunit
MALSWNEIRDRAVKFSQEWKDAESEIADSQSFWNDFFNIFGISRRRVASFQHRVKKFDNHRGFIDLFWKGVILIEHKSEGQNLDKAYEQAKDYFPGISEKDLPAYILVSDFARFRLYDLEEGKTHEFELKDLSKNIHLFGFIAGYQKKIYKEEDPVNIEAAMLMGKLHDKLRNIGYEGHPLEVYLVRLLFCLFADDTGIFEKDIFQEYIEVRTGEDGSDLAAHLAQIFFILNTPKEKRLKNIDESLNQFPHINGKLFEETLPPASFDRNMRNTLLECCKLNWSRISPAIFGSLFQSAMDPDRRRNLGAHYTSEKNILKLIKPLFLDDLYKEFENVRGSRGRLMEFHSKLANLKFLDPACGCGNFLVITYRELRLLEIEILNLLYKDRQQVLDITIFKLNIDRFYGIECEEFPARIAEVAMWLIDHQMNMKVSDEFGHYFSRVPLTAHANIIHGNALKTDWKTAFPCISYILGNPPFVGKHLQTEDQKQDMDEIFKRVNGAGVLDYVSAWYIKAAEYIQNTKIKAAFVSTNSIAQGEQVGILWNELFNKYNIKIHFAHRTFKWSNEAAGNAAVYCVIIGFAAFDTSEKYLYEYETPKSEAIAIKAKNISPYLVEAKDILILKRNTPICNVPAPTKGSQPTDGGNLLLSDEEKQQLITIEPKSDKFIRPFIGAREFLNNEKKWCLWLVNIKPDELKKMPYVFERVEKVRDIRLKSSKESTVKWAEKPTLFTENRQPKKGYLLIPRVSSENRNYIPMGFFNRTSIVGDTCLFITHATLFLFGVLTSEMHMAWTRYVCGRLENRFRYSNEIVYNNFPFPEKPNPKQIGRVEITAKEVLNIRKQYPESSLADLYHPLLMPPKLVKAHRELDKAVDVCYRRQPFDSESRRMEFLFELHEKYISPLLKKEKRKK